MTTAIAETLSTSGLDVETVLDLSRRADPVGVLSVYVDARPGRIRASSIEIKNRLAELKRAVAAEGPPARTRAVHDGIERLVVEIERLTNPEEPGRGRVLFAAISDTWLIRLPSQLPVPNRVVLDGSAFIHPLLELLDASGPVGVVLASRAYARLFEWRLGELIPLRELRAEPMQATHERSGPIGSRPENGYGTATGDEQRKAREREQTARFIDRVAAAASKVASDRGWERVLVSAGEQRTERLVAALPWPLREMALRDPRVLVKLDPATVEHLVTQRMRAAQAELDQRMIRKVREEAHRAGRAALGLSEVVGALNQARVAHLIYDPLIRYRGTIGQDGSLYANGERGLAQVWRADTRLTERLVERALETGARVTPVEGAASDRLADASGIAAVLHW
jgi:hypothetical protein